MAHNLSYNSITGKWEMMTRAAAWHNLGVVTKECKNWKDTADLVGFPLVSREQLQFNGELIPSYAIFRDDMKYIDPVKAYICDSNEDRPIIQYDFMMAYLDAIVESEGAHYESAGMLDNGARIWALINLGEAFEIGGSGDRYENGLCFVEDRRIGKAARCFLTTTRVVCANTLEMALNSAGETGVNFRHTQNLQQKLDQALNAFAGAPLSIQSLRTKLETLSERILSSDDLARIVERIFPAEDIKQASSVAREKRINNFLDLFEHNDNNMFPQIRGTAINAVNAATEDVDHFSPIRRTANRVKQTDNQIRSERAMFGAGAQWKNEVLEIVLEETVNSKIRDKSVVFDMDANTQKSAAAAGNRVLLDTILDGQN